MRTIDIFHKFLLIVLRYLYWFSGLLKYQVLFRHRFEVVTCGMNSDKQCLIIKPRSCQQQGIHFHLHGMGDGLWDGFKDGVYSLSDEFDLLQIMPDMGSATWCSIKALTHLADFIQYVHTKYPSTPIYLSGTSMGGSMVLGLLLNSNLQEIVSGVIVVSAAVRLDSLLTRTCCQEVKTALLNSVSGEVSELERMSFDTTEMRTNIPIYFLYSESDPVIPSTSITPAINILQEKGVQIKAVKMFRPPGHFRPTIPELRCAMEWLRNGTKEKVGRGPSSAWNVTGDK